MTCRIETSVLVVGAGPVGLTLAMDLAWRGIDVTIAEMRSGGEPPSVKCNQVSARSMELFRRLGFAKEVREAGLPADYPNDVVSATTVTGIELTRIAIPSRADRYTAATGPDTGWPTPEPPHRISQIYLEPVLFAHAASQPRIRILNRTAVEDFVQDEGSVVATATNLDSGERMSIACVFLVGCDGAKSTIRKAIGAKFRGASEIQRMQSTYIHAPALIGLLPGKPAWMYLSLNPRRCGTTIAVDGRETWLIHNALYRGEAEFDALDRNWAIRAILGVGSDFHYEVISKEDWVGRRLVADRFHDRRVFICGDAAHLWIPSGGYGMNAGIADAANLSWKIAAVLTGWAPAAMLHTYEAERQPITEQVSRFAVDTSLKIMQQRRGVPAEVEWPGAIGDAARRRIAGEAHDLDLQQQCTGGLNFGYFYDRSPIIAYDDEAHPAYTMHEFRPSTVPGCRAPHFWFGNRCSLYDALGRDYTLIRLDPTTCVSGIVEAAARRGVPLAVLNVDTSDAGTIYAHKLVLVRPDQHVAWRGNEEPVTPMHLIDVVRGADALPTRRAA